MKKIRIGNDFVFSWAIERGGVPENLETVLEKHLYMIVFGAKTEIHNYTVSGNKIIVEFTPEMLNKIGIYTLIFYYVLPDESLSDNDRKCAVDIDAFQIVPRTAMADDVTEFAVTSDMAIAFKGDKGDSAYQVWLDAGNTGTEEDYFAYLRQPATDAGASISELEGEIQVSEGLRVQAESERDSAETARNTAESERLAAETIRQSNEDNRIENEATRVQNEAERISKENVRQSNEIDRVEAESERVQAENERAQAESERQATIQEAVTATSLANEKANLANIAAQSANEAAGLADTARTELTTAVNTKLGEADAKIEEMDTTLSTYDGRVTQVESDISQLESDVSELELKDAIQSDKIKDIENILSTANLNQSAKISITGTSPLSFPKNAANSGMSVKLEGLTEDVGGVITHFEPTGRIRVEDASENEMSRFYLTAPELRSNGAVKDEIRKGANGYELVKRVGVGTSNGEIVINGDFDTADNWTIDDGAPIISDGTLKIVADAGVPSRITQNKTITAGRIYRYSINVLGITGVIYLYFGNNLVKVIAAADGIGVHTGFFIPSENETRIRLTKDLGRATNAEIDTLSIIEYNPAEGVAMAGGEAVFGSSVHYTLATPEIIPISYGGVLNSAENGTVYHEPVIADAGVYGTNMPILLPDYPISALEEIIIHKDGIDTYLDVSTAVIAPDGLSFTHPDLTEGDLVLFTYSFDKESTNGNITATFYDSNVVKIDTVTGKAYKITDVVTNGVLTRTLTEV